MSELMKETETKAVRALSDLISSDGGTLHNLRMILRAAIAQARKEERERCVAIVEKARKINEQKYTELESATDPLQRSIREAAKRRMGHDAIIKHALEADNE